LTPGFSQVICGKYAVSRFNGFPQTGARKAVETAQSLFTRRAHTGLKPGVNEKR